MLFVQYLWIISTMVTENSLRQLRTEVKVLSCNRSAPLTPADTPTASTILTPTRSVWPFHAYTRTTLFSLRTRRPPCTVVPSALNHPQRARSTLLPRQEGRSKSAEEYTSTQGSSSTPYTTSQGSKTFTNHRAMSGSPSKPSVRYPPYYRHFTTHLVSLQC